MYWGCGPCSIVCRKSAVASLFPILAVLLLQAATAGAVLVVNRAQVTIRADATVQSARVEVVVQGEELEKVRRKGEWYQVRLPDGRNGWVHASLVIEQGEEPAEPAVRPPRGSRPAEEPVAEPLPAAEEELRRNPYAEGLRHEVGGNYAAALRSFEEALQQDPENLNTLIHAAQAHLQLGEYDLALRQLYQALEKSPGNRTVYLHLGELYVLRAEADSARKYQALSRGEEVVPQEQEPVASRAEAEPVSPPVEDILWIYVAAVAGTCFLGLMLLWWWNRRTRRREEEESEELPAKKAERGKFAAALQEGARRPQLSAGEAAELDRRIEDKWQELRQSSAAFMPPELLAKARQGQAEEARLDEVVGYLEAIRKALAAQEERAHLYRELMRLQNMKIEALDEELRLLRRQRRD